MKRSTQVAAPLLAAAALSLLAGCRQPDMQRCVDENNRVVDPAFCQVKGQQRPDGHGGFVYIPPPYRFYYGGFGGYTPGTLVGGGGYTPLAGRSYSTTTRGGFGSSFGGGEGEGGAHGGSAGE